MVVVDWVSLPVSVLELPIPTDRPATAVLPINGGLSNVIPDAGLCLIILHILYTFITSIISNVFFPIMRIVIFDFC